MRLLNRNLLLGLIGLSSILVLSVGAYSYVWQHRVLQEQVKSTFHNSAADLAEHIGLAVKVLDLRSLHRAISKSFLLQHSKLVSVTNSRGEEIYSLPSSAESGSALSCPVVANQVPIRYAENTIGQVNYCFDLDAQIENGAFTYLLLAEVAGVLLVMLLVTLLFIYNTKPLNQFLNLIDVIDTENPSFPNAPTLSTSDTTVNALYGKMNRLLATLEKAANEKREAQKLVAIANTTAMLAHDVRRPFSMLRMALTAMQSTSEERQLRRLVARVVPEVDRALTSVDHMISDVMEIGKRSEPEWLPLSAGDVLRRAVEEIKFLKPHLSPQIKYTLEHTRPLLADRPRIMRLLLNLLDNAFCAGAVGGSLWITTRDGELNGQAAIEFVIGNDGPAIPESAMSQIFEPFFTQGKRGGTGLGLSVAQKIVLDHRGTIACRSSEAVGTEFHFLLPAYRLFSGTPPRKISARL